MKYIRVVLMINILHLARPPHLHPSMGFAAIAEKKQMEPVKIRPPERLPVEPPKQRLRRSVFYIKGGSMKFFSWVLARLKEASSWASMTAVAVFFGLDPEGADLLVQALVAVAGFLGFALKDKGDKSGDNS